MSTTAGIDLGSESIKGIVLRAAKKGPVSVVSAGALPIGDLGHMEDSPDKTLALGEKLKALVKSAGLKAQRRRIGASGSATAIRYLHVPPVPPWRLEMLVKYEVEERLSEQGKNAYDFRILDVPESGGQYTVMIGMCRENTASDLLATGKAAGLRQVDVDLEALALYNAYYHGHGFDQDKTVLVVDIGADDMTVLVCRNGALYFARTLMGAGRRFTQALADELKVDLEEAEKIKRTEAEITFDAAPVGSVTRIGRVPRTGMTAINRAGASGVLPRPTPGGLVTAAPRVAPAASAPNGAAQPKPLESADLPMLELEPPAVEGRAVAPGPARQLAPSPRPLPALEPAAPTGIIKKTDGRRLAPDTPVEDGQPQLLSRNPDFQPVSGSVDDLDLAPLDRTVRTAHAIEGASEIAPDPIPRGAPAPATQPPILTSNGNATQPEVAEVNEETPPSLEFLDSATAAMPPAEKPVVDVEKRKRQISAALGREAATMCAALENAVLFCKQQTKQAQLKVDRVYVTGGGSRLKGFTEFMGRRLRMEVLPLEPFRQLSLDNLPAQEAEALRAEQHTMAVAVGLAVSDLQKGAFSYLLWPQALKESKSFWARGAYLYYAAGLAAAALGLGLYIPVRNRTDLLANNQKAELAVQAARGQNEQLNTLLKDNDEKRQQLKQIVDNTQSGQYFLTLLAELKSTQRISADIYLTQITTNLPNVVKVASGDSGGLQPTTSSKATAEKNAEPDTFQAQRRVYLRGFVRSNRIEKLGNFNKFKDDADKDYKWSQRDNMDLEDVIRKEQSVLIEKIMDFYQGDLKRGGQHLGLVPYPDKPDHPDNLFKDIRPIWLGKEYHEDKFIIKEFVLEAYTEGTREPPKPKTPTRPIRGKPGAAGVTTGATAGAQAQVQPAAPQAAPAPDAAQPAQPAPVAQPAAPVQPVQPAPVVQPAAPMKLAPKAQPAQPAPKAQPAPAQPEQQNPPAAPKQHKFVLPAKPPVGDPPKPPQ